MYLRDKLDTTLAVIPSHINDYLSELDEHLE
jgi:hypothetical protein